MQSLKPFQGSLPIHVEAELSVSGTLVTVEFKIDGGEGVLGLPSQTTRWSPDQAPRQDGLWATTCFEAFLRPVGLDSYYEFNFSLSPAWNVYEFTDYRKPQPPTASKAFQLIGMSWDAAHSHFQIQLDNHTGYREFKVSLTTVLEEKNHSKHHLAVAHTQDKPDFHAKNSFILQRGSSK